MSSGFVLFVRTIVRLAVCLASLPPRLCYRPYAWEASGRQTAKGAKERRGLAIRSRRLFEWQGRCNCLPGPGAKRRAPLALPASSEVKAWGSGRRTPEAHAGSIRCFQRDPRQGLPRCTRGTPERGSRENVTDVGRQRFGLPSASQAVRRSSRAPATPREGSRKLHQRFPPGRSLEVLILL